LEICIFLDTLSAMYLIEKTTYFDAWLRKLKDTKAKAKILTRLKMVELGNLGDHKSIGNRISELRISYDSGYRVYHTKRKDIILLILIGGDKSSLKSGI